jgi:hypothetical protein
MEACLREPIASQRWQYFNDAPGVLYVNYLKNAAEHPLIPGP